MNKKKPVLVEKHLLNCMKDPVSSFIDSFWREVDNDNDKSLYLGVIAETDYDEDDGYDSPDDAIIRLFEKTYKKLVKRRV